MTSQNPTPCIACGLQTTAQLCPSCLPAGDLLSSDPLTRVEALMGEVDRGKVLLAFFRGGRLWDDVTVDGESMGSEIVRWLCQHDPTPEFSRWIAEDSKYGVEAMRWLGRHDRGRSLLRAPVWVSPERSDQAAAGQALLAGLGVPHPSGIYALAFRLGGCAEDAEERAAYAKVFPAGIRWIAAVPLRAGQRWPGVSRWRPDEQSRPGVSLRRWPVERISEYGLGCCAVCGEFLSARSTVCCWCGTDSAEEPMMWLPLRDILTDRNLCTVCSFDQTSQACPIQCAGCGTSTA